MSFTSYKILQIDKNVCRSLFGPVLLGLNRCDEDLPSSSWVCCGGVPDEVPTLGGLQMISHCSNNIDWGYRLAFYWD